MRPNRQVVESQVRPVATRRRTDRRVGSRRGTAPPQMPVRGLLGFAGKAGGGLAGDFVSKGFGSASAITTPSAIITASVVTVNGATVGGIGTAGTNGLGDKLPTGGTAPVGTVDSLPLGELNSSMGKYAQAIKDIESGGGNYGALGKVITRKDGSSDQALGAYQVMRSNLPSWSKEATGRSMTADEFLKNPAAQDAVFANKFGPYVDKYGPTGAAQAWIGGPGSVGKLGRTDANGTSVGSYGDQFNRSLARQGADLSQSADAASKSVSDLSTKLGDMPDAANAFTSSISQIEQAMQKGLGSSGGGFGGLGGLGFGNGGGGNNPVVDSGQMIDGTHYMLNGGIMTSRGQIPLNRYAGGGVATSPQIAMFGEGRGPEAYVPLPDGRSIPVSMKGMPANTNAPGAAPMSITHNPTTIIQGSNLSRDDMLATLNQRDAENRRVLLGEIDNRQRRYG